MRHVKIPPHWDAHEALNVVSFLERVIDAVWRAHGPDMAEALYEHEAHRRRVCHHALELRPTPCDDDLPL